MSQLPFVLVVEDSPTDQKLILKLLELEGYRAVVVGSAEEGLLTLATSLPRLLILDLDLPGISGLELTRRLRADRRTARLPILAVSCTAGPAAGPAALAAGCDWFLPKPLDLREFSVVVAKWLGPA